MKRRAERSKESMTATEARAAFSLAGIFSLRMLGLFMIYPVFAVYAEKLTGHTAASVGLALGIYGLAQAIFQIPLGMVSDRVGRKPVIAMGLLVFAAGSAVAAMSTSIEGVIIGRAVQGAGAVGSTLLALGADLTSEQNRTKAMAVIGMTIGFSFAVAVVLGPILNGWIGVPGIFWLTAVLALGGIAVLQFVVPRPVHSRVHRDTEPVPALFKRVLTDGQLLRMDFGIFSLHLVLTASFVALPLALAHGAGIQAHSEWYFYLPILLISVIAMVPLIIIAETRQRMKQIFLGAVLAITLVELVLMEWSASVIIVGVALTVFFTAFNLLEASLPSLISKMAPADSKGTAMGVYSSSQFLGIFVGGAAGGWLYGHYEATGVFAFTTAVGLIWFALSMGMNNPRQLTSRLLSVGQLEPAKADALQADLARLDGVEEVVVVADEGVAYLKVDKRKLDETALRRFETAPV